MIHNPGEDNMALIKSCCDTKRNDTDDGELTASVKEQEQVIGQMSSVSGPPVQVLQVVEGFIHDMKHDDLPSGTTVRIGELCFELGRFEEAKFFFEKAATCDPGNADALNNLGVVHVHCGDLETALTFFTKALDRDPNNRDARKNIAIINEHAALIADPGNPADESYELTGMTDYWDACAKDNAMRHIACDDWQSEQVFNVCGERDLAQLLANIDEDMLGAGVSRVLEIGCGIGRMLKPFAIQYPDLQVVGVDVSEEMIRKGRARLAECSNVRMFKTSGKDLSIFDDNSFQFIYSYIVFQHIPRKFVYTYFKEISRVLDKDGLFLFQMPMVPDHMEVNEPPDSDFRSLRCYSSDEIERMCRTNDLELVKRIPIGRHENYAISSAWFLAGR